MKIAIIDDEMDICFILAFEIQSLGHQVVQFNSAIDAQKYFESESVDVIICDFQMPKLSGLDFFKWLRGKNITTPFIVLTGETQMEADSLIK